jgi:hypothetical protein
MRPGTLPRILTRVDAREEPEDRASRLRSIWARIPVYVIAIVAVPWLLFYRGNAHYEAAHCHGVAARYNECDLADFEGFFWSCTGLLVVIVVAVAVEALTAWRRRRHLS